MIMATIYCAEHCNLHKAKGEYTYLSLYLKRLYFMMKGMFPGLVESGDVSWVPRLILYLWEVWTGMDHFLVFGICIRNHKQLGISACQPWGQQ